MEPWIFYHLIMLAVDLMLIRSMIKHSPTTIRRGFVLCVIGVAAAVLLASFVFEGGFRYSGARYGTEGILFHGGGFLAVACFLVARQRINGKRRWALTLFLGFLAATALLIGIEGLIIGPTAISAKYYTIRTPKVSKPVRIAFLTDFQTDNVGDYERKTFELLKEQHADMIIYGGDYIQPRTKDHEERLFKEFNEFYHDMNIYAPLGVFAVKGNQELGSWIGWGTLFEDGGVFKSNNTTTIDAGEIRLKLLSVYDSFTPARRRYNNPENRFNVLVGHAPIFALGSPNVDLLLAGHTHGGQVQIPGFGPIITLTEGVPRRWASGLTKLPNGSTLIVSHGSGHERGGAPRIRLFCRPDLVVVDILPLVIQSLDAPTPQTPLVQSEPGG